MGDEERLLFFPFSKTGPARARMGGAARDPAGSRREGDRRDEEKQVMKTHALTPTIKTILSSKPLTSKHTLHYPLRFRYDSLGYSNVQY